MLKKPENEANPLVKIFGSQFYVDIVSFSFWIAISLYVLSMAFTRFEKAFSVTTCVFGLFSGAFVIVRVAVFLFGKVKVHRKSND